jgi:hypothetical protein
LIVTVKPDLIQNQFTVQQIYDTHFSQSVRRQYSHLVPAQTLHQKSMPSYEHKKLCGRIATLDIMPVDHASFSGWIQAQGHLDLLRHNAVSDDVILYASGEYTFINAAAVSNDKLTPLNQKDLLAWNCGVAGGVACYVSGGGHAGTWIERGIFDSSSSTVHQAMPLVFLRTFHGWSGAERSYFEIHQELVHLLDVHWRAEHEAYCRFDRQGDLEHVISASRRGANNRDILLVSCKRASLDEYLTAANMSLVQMFDFTLVRHDTFTKWPNTPEKTICESDQFFFRQQLIPGYAAYTRGVQVVHPLGATPRTGIDRLGGPNEQHVEFIAHDWRNQRLAKISTSPSATTNYFDASANSLPYEISPAFFRPEVLLKYKADRDKYIVGEREVRCRATWTLQAIDVNEAGQVHAYIRYLKNIPYAEQLHWLSYNEEPKAGVSKRAIASDFEGKFSSGSTSPLMRVKSIVGRWHEKRVSWWTLRDETLIERATIPVTTSRDEWAEAFMDLSKFVVEGFEVGIIRKSLDAASIEYKATDQSIALLERLVGCESADGDPFRLAGLRTVQAIRSKAKGHAGSSEAAEIARNAVAEHGGFPEHFKHVCNQVADELKIVTEIFTTKEDGC